MKFEISTRYFRYNFLNLIAPLQKLYILVQHERKGFSMNVCFCGSKECNEVYKLIKDENSRESCCCGVASKNYNNCHNMDGLYIRRDDKCEIRSRQNTIDWLNTSKIKDRTEYRENRDALEAQVASLREDNTKYRNCEILKGLQKELADLKLSIKNICSGSHEQ